MEAPTAKRPSPPLWPYNRADQRLRLKGSLHNHTITADIRTPPAKVRQAYQDAGYQFAAITDHDRRMSQLTWTDDDYELTIPGEFVMLRGYEASFPQDHVNCVGCLPRDLSRQPADPGFVKEAKQTGAFVFLNHPAKHNDLPERVLDDPELASVHAIEVYSGARIAKQPGPLAAKLWDACLARGLRLWALASPDCHHYDPTLPDAHTNGYVVAFADAIEPHAIMHALRTGCFYASTGVDVERVSWAHGALEVVSANADAISFIGPNGLLATHLGPTARYAIAGHEGYVRVELHRNQPCFDAPQAPRQTAWLQPLWL